VLGDIALYIKGNDQIERSPSDVGAVPDHDPWYKALLRERIAEERPTLVEVD